MRTKQKQILIICMCIVFSVGLGFSLYPCLHGAYLEQQQRQQSQFFISLIEDPASLTNEPDATEEVLEHAALRKDVEAYNDQLFTQSQSQLNGRNAYETPSFLLSDYGLTEEVFAVISIPVLDLEMPVYLGASSENLAMGAAHMSQTSLPIGGENTNSVIAGHRSWKGAAYFREIPSLQTGDKIYITNLWETLTYQVAEKKIIYSSDSEEILIQPGKDLLTLLTCYYGSDGVKYRYLVICERTSD